MEDIGWTDFRQQYSRILQGLVELDKHRLATQYRCMFELLNHSQKAFKDDKTREGLKQIQIQSAIAVTLTEYLKSDPLLSAVCVVPLKNLIFYVHQNYLLLCDFIYRKLPSETVPNVIIFHYYRQIWANQLQATIMNKRVHKFKKGEEMAVLLRNSESISQIIGTTRKTAFATLKQQQQQSSTQQQQSNVGPTTGETKIKNMLLNCAGSIVKRMSKCTIKQARDLLSKSLEATVSMSLFA